MFVSPMFDMFLAIMGKLNQVGANIMASIRILLSLSAIAESSEMWGLIQASLSFDVLLYLA